jgi:hypothetical protein
LKRSCGTLQKDSLAVASGPNDVTAEEKGREADDHKTPERDHIPIQMDGFVRQWSAVAGALD